MARAVSPHHLQSGEGWFKQLPDGFRIPTYGLGTWGMGGWQDPDTTYDKEDLSVIRAAIELGVQHIDTAEMYGGGHAEELVGKAIRGFDRSRLFLASKAVAHHLSRAPLVRAAEQSLRRLQTDYLDLYMVHHPSDVIPIEDTMAGMDDLVRRGLLRYVGVSNFSRDRLIAARQASPQPIVADQVHYSVRVRDPERSGLLAYCQQNDVMLVAWQPVEQGAPGDLLHALAASYDATAVQTALTWLISQPNVVTIARTRRLAHLRENLGALGWRMYDNDVELLRTQYQDQVASSEVYPLR
jgi:diketogulonate reductase-like aldo/keto reductase